MLPPKAHPIVKIRLVPAALRGGFSLNDLDASQNTVSGDLSCSYL
jgi:hypothetical protein